MFITMKKKNIENARIAFDLPLFICFFVLHNHHLDRLLRDCVHRFNKSFRNLLPFPQIVRECVRDTLQMNFLTFIETLFCTMHLVIDTHFDPNNRNILSIRHNRHLDSNFLTRNGELDLSTHKKKFGWIGIGMNEKIDYTCGFGRVFGFTQFFFLSFDESHESHSNLTEVVFCFFLSLLWATTLKNCQSMYN